MAVAFIVATCLEIAVKHITVIYRDLSYEILGYKLLCLIY